MLNRVAALPEWLRVASGIVDLAEILEGNLLPPPFDPDPACFPVLSCLVPIDPISDVDELLDTVAHMFEVVDTPEVIERVVDGILRLGHETIESFELKTEPLRHAKVGTEWIGQTPAGILMWSVPNVVKLIGAWLHIDFEHPWNSSSDLPALEVVSRRVGTFRPDWQSRAPIPALATPTHRGGWIDARVFVRRLNAIFAADRLPNRLDLIGGVLRLVPDFCDEAMELAKTLPSAYRRIVQYALGGDARPTKEDSDRADLWLAAGRARQPRGDIDELHVVGLSDKEPSSAADADFQFNPEVDPAEFKHARWSSGHVSRTVSVTPREASLSTLHSRPTVALAARLLDRQPLTFLQNWQQELMTSVWPANPDATMAVACHQLMTRLDDRGSVFEPVEGLLTPLATPDRGWSEIGRVALWLSLLSRNDQARGFGIDIMIDGIDDGRAHPDPLGQTLTYIASGGWIKLNRLTDALHEVTRTSVLAERVVAESLDQLIASWESPPRDAYHVLGLQLELLANLGQAPLGRSKAVLQEIRGNGKAAKLSRQLCELEPLSCSALIRQSSFEAARGRIERCERVLRYIDRERQVSSGSG
ncbi:MAG: hypothetical protein H8E66_21145 [Planctomycetes bacterium]|nr:hypothetical protein [Planctomycetota bacterium]